MAIYYLAVEGEAGTLDLDDYVQDIELDLPSRDFKLIDTLSNGGVIRGFGNFSGRKMQVSTKFRASNETQRQTILQWFSRAASKEMYLYKAISGFTGRMRVWGMPSGGESYKQVSISDSIKFTLFSKSTFFEATTLTTAATISVTSTTMQNETVTVNGADVNPIFYFTPSADFSFIQIKNSENYGLRSDYTFISGTEIIIDTRSSTLTITINGVEVYNTFSSTSRPFLLDQVTNSLDIWATSGTLLVKYYERRL